VDYAGGRFEQTAAAAWTEINNDGEYRFSETARDEWSVYLFDEGRALGVQIDLHTSTIYFWTPDVERTALYEITAREAGAKPDPADIAGSRAPAGVTGWNVARVEHVGGAFTENAQGGWTEISPNGERAFDQTGRDQWSVYLFDPVQNAGIQLDLFMATIYYWDENTEHTPLYEITGAQAK
jgi:hypothetical protein